MKFHNFLKKKQHYYYNKYFSEVIIRFIIYIIIKNWKKYKFVQITSFIGDAGQKEILKLLLGIVKISFWNHF